MSVPTVAEIREALDLLHRVAVADGISHDQACKSDDCYVLALLARLPADGVIMTAETLAAALDVAAAEARAAHWKGNLAHQVELTRKSREHTERQAERARKAEAETKRLRTLARDVIRYADDQMDPVLAVRPEAALRRLASTARAALAPVDVITDANGDELERGQPDGVPGAAS